MSEGTVVGLFFYLFGCMTLAANWSKEIKEVGRQLESADLTEKEGIQNAKTQRKI